MSNLFSINSPIVYATLVLLIILSVVTWSVTLFKLWKQWQSKKQDREFTDRFWSVREWQRSGEGGTRRSG